MTNEEKDKIIEFRNKCKDLYDSDEHYIPDDFENEMFKFFNHLIYKYDWEIIADNTHRWVDSDGWYEVEFTMKTEFGDVYINTVNGDRELEDEWSPNNPQNATIYDCGLGWNTWYWYYFLNNLIKIIYEL